LPELFIISILFFNLDIFFKRRNFILFKKI